MSWSVKSTGTPSAVKVAIQKNASISAALKAALSEICDEPPYSKSGNDAIAIDGSGHAGEGSYIHSLKVERITLAKGA